MNSKRKIIKFITVVKRFNGVRLNEVLLDDLIMGKVRFPAPSPGISLELLRPIFADSFPFLQKFNLSCFFCNSSICALKK